MELGLGIQRVGVFGGSFDPPHLAHLIMAQEALEQLCLDRVLFIPAFIPPHKQDRQQVPAEDRLEMLRRAVAKDSRFLVSDMELRRGGISYTVDTIRALKSLHPKVEWILLMGSDSARGLDTWHQVDALLSLCEVAVFLRPDSLGFEKVISGLSLSEADKKAVLKNVLNERLVDISSTEIRQRVRSGRSIRYLVPSEVESFIEEHSFYQE